MCRHRTRWIGLFLTFVAGAASAQDRIGQPAFTPIVPAKTSAVSLGQPRRLEPVESETPVRRVSATSYVGIDLPPRVVRGQIPPPAPAFPGTTGPAPFSPVPGGGPNPYSCGQPNNDADLGGFWSRCCDKMRRCWENITGTAGDAFRPTSGQRSFASDCEFRYFASPVSNPFYFEDPRALTEIRPVFIWQKTPNSNPVWAGGNNFFVAARGSVAFTENISLVVSRLGWQWINPEGGVPGYDSANGLSEVHLGPKITFYRNVDSRLVMAAGVNLEIPAGPSRVLQDTGNLSIEPYFALAKSFGKFTYGSFNYMNTTGYSFRTDSQRSDSFFSSFHLDYNVGDLGRIYPLVELNWRYYVRNGGARDFNFEGNDLGNFGSTMVSGFHELTVAVGSRFRITENVHFGIAGEFNVLNNSGGRHLDQFRLTTDLIFRY